MEGTQFPVDSLRDAAPLLRRPFTAEAIRFKIQTAWSDGAMVVAHIDARLVTERLNLVVPHLWSDDYESIGNQLLLCRLTVDGVTRRDVGQGTGKALWSDAFKRAGVKFGVGVSVYALPQIVLQFGGADNQLRKDNKSKPKIDDRTDRKLRDGYRKWLLETGVPKFGEALDHGDIAESQGDIEVAEVETEDVGSALPLLTDERADRLRADLRAAYDVIRETDPQAIPPGEFNRQVEQAGHSHEELEELLARLSSRVAA